MQPSAADVKDVFETAETPVLSQSEIAEQLEVNESSVQPALDQLEARGDLTSRPWDDGITIYWPAREVDA